RYWERKRDEIRRKNIHIEKISSQYESNLEEVNKQKKEIISKARQEAEQLLSESNAKIEQTIREIRQSQAEKEKTKQIRQTLNEFRDKMASPISSKEEKPALKKKIKKNTTQQPPQKAPLSVGDNVRLKGQTSVGEIMDISGKKAVVAFGMIKSTVGLEKLEQVSNNQLKKEQKAQSNTRDLLHERRLNFKQEIDVRGMRGDEALQAVMYFIDDAIQLGIARVRILHGTGTGALRQIIRDYLRAVNEVAHYQDEHVQFGGAGITVVDLH
ncbi:MAG: Smr/MutS family protein, partial [Petrimonas sp.]|nr:Smr/MutS family protein [Petrimonas sp.]